MGRQLQEEVLIPPEGLAGVLAVPEGARGLVAFAHGSGSGRMSPRNRHVAAELQRAHFATLLLDLLTPDEERRRENVFDITLLAARLGSATRWARTDERTAPLAVAYFGASTGAAAALVAAAHGENGAAAVVSRGGRPDLAGPALSKVRAPTLLIVGRLDAPVIPLNRQAYDQLRCEKELSIVEGAGHLFEEAGTLDAVVRLAAAWFERFVPAASARRDE
ncbi:alpha/beta hydrolase [Schlegelella sp. S2-27]|uniref:Alpha/beta hydrolase n=1 Tax=Caldimonas mangrovi TaxID=2944811 RepID=A0ABT0YPS2_9BURK|nr:alpha/beta hydrolase [Caldimonas mangrovi]